MEGSVRAGKGRACLGKKRGWVGRAHVWTGEEGEWSYAENDAYEIMASGNTDLRYSLQLYG